MNVNTHEIRRLLTQRGTPWVAVGDECTHWKMPVRNEGGTDFSVEVSYDGALHMNVIMTPTQAIALTRRRDIVDDLWSVNKKLIEKVNDRTCRNASTSGNFICSECSAMMVLTDSYGEPILTDGGVATVPRYCPICGAKVVEMDEWKWMSATDELRKMLDERGVEHYDGTESTLWLKDEVGYRASADEGLNGFIHLRLWCITPAQAVEATLGRGTCRNSNETMKSGDYGFLCSECGAFDDAANPKYCHECGRKVVDE